MWLDQAGYRNALLGKYFNEYPYHPGSHLSDDEKAERRAYVPPGWQSWASPVQGNAYAQEPLQDERRRRRSTPTSTRTTWTAGSASGRWTWSTARTASTSPTAGSSSTTRRTARTRRTPILRELEGSFADAQYPRTPDFDEADVSDKFGLTRTRAPLSASDIATIDETFRKRIRSVQVLDQNVARLVQELDDEGALDNTYLIFTSDNGYHMGNHRREIGKYTQFQTDVHVPFYIRGPGITPGSTYDDVAGNIDIAPTIADIAGATTPEVDGLSLLPRLHGGEPLSRRYFLLGRALTPTNTTTANGLEEAPETYVESTRSSRLNDFTGVTNGRYKLIRYTHLRHEELYDLANDPYELDNLLRLRRGVLPRDVAEGPGRRRHAAGRARPVGRLRGRELPGALVSRAA